MRTEEIWQNKILPQIIKKRFPPRIQQDLENINTLKIPENVSSCYIYGDTNFGKTIYAAGLLLQEEKNLYLNNIIGDCVFINMPEFFNDLRKSYQDVNVSEQEIIDYVMNAHLVILDDLTVDKPTDWLLGKLYLIINYRYEHLKKTIITNNISLDAMAKLLGDSRITSRIKRQGKVLQKKHW